MCKPLQRIEVVHARVRDHFTYYAITVGYNLQQQHFWCDKRIINPFTDCTRAEHRFVYTDQVNWQRKSRVLCTSRHVRIGLQVADKAYMISNIFVQGQWSTGASVTAEEARVHCIHCIAHFTHTTRNITYS